MSQNMLAFETSPYLLQHAGNPVHWRAWGPNALAEARELNKPILLSIGYAACHWCHVMAHESFEDAETAAVMNRLFVSIKVDREERPDVDHVYMQALLALGQSGGWPLTMFLDPDGNPIWGGTYFPHTARYGLPSFIDVLEEVARLFAEEPDRIGHNREALRQRLTAPQPSARPQLQPATLDAANDRILAFYDPLKGGFRGAPKFPQATVLELLWRQARRTGEPAPRDAVLITLRHICQGGIYDHIGGGFCRYAVDEHWLVPHFEKMLYDQAQLIDRLTQAWLVTGEDLFRTRIEETVAWLQRDMLLPGGAFAASLDADSPGGEGAYYLWTPETVEGVLGPAEATLFARAYDITPAGNFEGRSIPNRLATMALPDPEQEARLQTARAKLLEARSNRPPPTRDDKVLADWNGLLVAALARAGSTFRHPEWVELACAAFHFVRESLSRDGRLGHSFRAGALIWPGFATDYAALIRAALALAAATLDRSYVEEAARLADTCHRHHWEDSIGAYALTAHDGEPLVTRPLIFTDDATPSPNALMADGLVRLWAMTGDDQWRARADAVLSAGAAVIADNVIGTAALLSALDQTLHTTEIVLLTPAGSDPQLLVETVRRHWHDATVLTAIADGASLSPLHPAAGRRAIDGRPTAFVCRNQTCSLPVTDPDALARLLATA